MFCWAHNPKVAGSNPAPATNISRRKAAIFLELRAPAIVRRNVSDFHENGEEATVRLHEKGDKRRTIGLHSVAAAAIAEYVEKAEIKSGPLFRPRLNSRSTKLGKGRINLNTEEERH